MKQHFKLNPVAAELETPAIPLTASWAKQYVAQLGPLIDLSQAVPNYTPYLRYPAVSLALAKKVICRWCLRILMTGRYST